MGNPHRVVISRATALNAVFFFCKRSSHTDVQATRTVELLHFGNTTTKTAMPHIRVPLVFPSQKKQNAFNKRL